MFCFPRISVSIALLLAMVASSGCTTVAPGTLAREPIVDMKGVNHTAYNRDYNECLVYAKKVDPAHEIAEKTLIGALFGAAVGAATGAAFGRPGFGAAVGASGGGIGGIYEGAYEAASRQKEVLYNCLKGRGYRVLG